MVSGATTELGACIREVLTSLKAPIFAAIWVSKGEARELSVHVAAGPERARLKTEILAGLSAVGVSRAKVHFHKASKLLAPRSLERLVARFASNDADAIAFDPTDSISRASALVRASSMLRSSLTDKIRGFYFAPRLRAFYVVLEAGRVASNDKFKVIDLANIERAVGSALKSAFSADLAQCPAVRVGFGLPGVELVPVDQASIIRWNQTLARAIRRYWKPVAIAAMFGFGAAATASAEGPAVSETNLKTSVDFGKTEGDSTFFVNGALTAPLGPTWGLQIEAGAGNVDSTGVLGAAGHLFTRDPDSYLLGLFAAYASEDEFSLDATRLGAEAEIYLSQISILAKAGYQFSDAFKEGSFGEIELRWYMSENFAMSGGVSVEEDATQTHLGAEWQPGFSALPGLAFHVDGVWGEDDYDSFMGGLRYYFGADASLKDRHRRQDPESALFNLFRSVEAERNRCSQYGQHC